MAVRAVDSQYGMAQGLGGASGGGAPEVPALKAYVDATGWVGGFHGGSPTIVGARSAHTATCCCRWKRRRTLLPDLAAVHAEADRVSGEVITELARLRCRTRREGR